MKIDDLINKKVVEAKIVEALNYKGNLPSLADNWRFNFKKHSKAKNVRTFVLVCEHSEDVIEGCLIFEMRDKTEPYMAYLEIAHHNKGEDKRYDKVAGCLIAFASRLSFIHGEDFHKGWLAFDVLEETTEDEEKLMALYSKKYNAMRLEGTTLMIISPENGEKLIEFYLNS